MHRSYLIMFLYLTMSCQKQALPDATKQATRDISEPKEAQRRYFGQLPWMDASLIATSKPEGGTDIIVTGEDHDVQKIRAGAEIGWSPTLKLDLWQKGGEFDKKDKLIVTWSDGHRHECLLRGRQQSDRHIRASCRAHRLINSPDNHLFLGADATATVSYWDASVDKTQALGEFKIQVIRIDALKGNDVQFRIDRRQRMKEAELLIRPFGKKIPPTSGEQPHIKLIMQHRSATRGHNPRPPRLSCKMGEQVLFSGIYPDDRYSRQIDWAQGHPEGWPNPPMEAGAQQWIYWKQIDFPLPYQIGDLDKGLPAWPKKGQWQCQIDWEGETVRRFEMTVEHDGRIKVAEGTPLKGAGWPITLSILPSKIEDGGQ